MVELVLDVGGEKIGWNKLLKAVQHNPLVGDLKALHGHALPADPDPERHGRVVGPVTGAEDDTGGRFGRW